MTSNERPANSERLLAIWEEALKCFFKKDYQNALRLFDETDRDLGNWIATDDTMASWLGLVANQAFVSAYEMNQFPRALYYANRECDLVRQDSPTRARALNNRGLALLEAGRLLKAESSFREALSVLDKYRGDEVVSIGVDVHQLRSVVQRHLAMVSNARRESEDDIIEEPFAPPQLNLRGHGNLVHPTSAELDTVNKAFFEAKAAQNRGNFSQAIKICAAAVSDIRRRSNEPKVLGIALSNLGCTYLSAGIFAKAVEHLQEASEVLEGTPRPSEHLVLALHNLSVALLKGGKTEEALDAAKLAWLEIKDVAPDTPNAVMVLHQLALLRLLTKDYKRARAGLYHAMRIYDVNRKHLADSEAEHEGVFGVYRSLVELLLLITVHEQWPDEAMTLVENAKARFWNEHLERLFSTDNIEHIGTATHQGLELDSDDSWTGGHEITHIGKYITDPECLLINFFTGPNHTFIITFYEGQLKAKRIDIAENKLQKEVDTFIKDIQSSSRRELWRESGKQLASKLFGSVQVTQPWPKQIQVVPDGPLWYLPFDFLPLKDRGQMEATDPPIFMVAPTAHIPSAKLLDRYRPENLKSRKGQTPKILAIARSTFASDLYDLKSVETEIKAVEELSGGNDFWALREHEATRNSVMPQLGLADVIHIATHAITNPQEAQSKIVLSDGTSGDDNLWASEIAELKLRAQVVFLSACSSAVGRLSAGEGLTSIARAFLLSSSEKVL